MTHATLLTRDATLDDLSLSDYMDMFWEIRGKMSLDRMVVELRSEYSKAQWWKVEHSEMVPNRIMRNELRRHHNRPPLPPTVAEVTAQASPDAAVWQVGDGTPDTVIMVTAPHPLTLHVNGSVTVAGNGADVPCYPSNTPLPAQVRRRRHVTRPTPSEAQVARFTRLSVTWRAVLDAGLSALEREAQR